MPKIDKGKIDRFHAQIAKNVDLRSGSLAAMKSTLERDDIVLKEMGSTGEQDSFYKVGSDWLAFSSDTDLVISPIADSNDRCYWTDGVDARKADALTLLTSSSYKMGIPAPTTTPTINYNNDPSPPADPNLQDTISYVYCYVTGWGEEGPPCEPTAVVDVEEGKYITLTGISFPTNYAADYNIVGYRVYRLSAGTQGAEYMLLECAEMDDDTTTGGHIPVADTTVTDRNGVSAYEIIPATDLTDTLQTENCTAPPVDLEGLILLSNGVMAGFKNNEVYVSEPGLPYAFPSAYVNVTDFDVVGLGYFGTTIVVLTKGTPYLIDGFDPLAMVMRRIPKNQSCLSKRGIVSTENGVLYPSPDGLVLVQGGAEVITREFITKEQFAELSPETWVSVMYEGQYIAFCKGTTTGYIFNLAAGEPEYTSFELPRAVNDVYSDPLTDKLYLLGETGAFDYDAWVQVAPELNSQDSVYDLAILNDKLYGCTVDGTDGGRLFEWNGSDAWVQVAPRLLGQDVIQCLAVYNDKLYGGGGYPAGTLFEWNGTDAWVQVAPELNAEPNIYDLVVYNDKLYGAAGGRLYEWNGSNAWVQKAPELSSQYVLCLAVYNGKLYGGTSDAAGGRLFEWNGTGAWVQVAPQLNSQTGIESLAVYNGKLYGGTHKTGGPGGYLYEWNGIDAWIQVAPEYSGGSTIHSLCVYNGNLYGGDLGGHLLRWNDTDAWVLSAPQLNSQSRMRGLTVYGDKLYCGTYPDGSLFEYYEDVARVDEWQGATYVYDEDEDLFALGALTGFADDLQFDWKSKEFTLPEPSNFMCGRVMGEIEDGGVTTFEMYVDGEDTPYHTEEITPGEVFTLPGDRLYDTCSIKLSGAESKVDVVQIATSVEELREV